jgi:putative ABC transport system permease protein
MTLKDEGRSSSGRAHNRIRNLLIVSEIALGFVILIGAGLLTRTLMQIRHASPGFNPDHLLTFQISFDIGNDSIPEKVNFETRWEQALSSLPGVQYVGAVSHLPLDDYPNWYNWYQPEGVTEEQARSLVADLRCATPGYFQAIGARLIAGRHFTDQDTAYSQDVAIIDETLANQEWPGQSAVGKKIYAQHHMDGPFIHKWTEVVGVVEHIKMHNMLRPVRSQIYMPFAQSARWHMSYTVRTNGDMSSLVPRMREELAKIDKNLAMAKVRPMNDYVSNAMAPTNFTVVLAGIFAGFALLLATIGIYGVISYSVSQRTHEIGIRLALGATPANILRLIIKEGLRLTVVGLVIGFAASFLLTGYLQNMLFGVTPTDPITYAIIIGLIPLAAIVACWRPARKAAAGSPMDALRQQI